MRASRARSRGTETLSPIRSLAGFTIDTPESSLRKRQPVGGPISSAPLCPSYLGYPQFDAAKKKELAEARAALTRETLLKSPQGEKLVILVGRPYRHGHGGAILCALQSIFEFRFFAAALPWDSNLSPSSIGCLAATTPKTASAIVARPAVVGVARTPWRLVAGVAPAAAGSPPCAPGIAIQSQQFHNCIAGRIEKHRCN